MQLHYLYHYPYNYLYQYSLVGYTYTYTYPLGVLLKIKSLTTGKTYGIDKVVS